MTHHAHLTALDVMGAAAPARAWNPLWDEENPGACTTCGATDRSLTYPVWQCTECIKAAPSNRCAICAGYGIGADGLCDVCRYTWGTLENREAAHRDAIQRYEEERAFQESQKAEEPCPW